MDLIVWLLVGLILWQAKPEKGFREDYLSLSGIKPWRGIFAMVVILHHLAQRTTGGYLLPEFLKMSILAVAGFCFFSGYGLQKRYLTGPDYRKNFLRLRIPSILIPYGIMVLVYWVAFSLTGHPYSPGEVLASFVSGDPLVPYSWYIILLLIFYLVFYLLMTICGKKYGAMVLGGILFYLVFTAVCMVRGFGNWWYNTAQLLVLGMFWAVYEKKLLAVLKKHTWCWFCLAGTGFLAVYLLRPQILETMVCLGIPGNTFCVEFIMPLLFVITCVLAMGKIRVGNAVLNFLGEISLELYLIQGLGFLILDQLHLESELLYGLLLLAGVILGAWGLHGLFRRILGSYRSRVMGKQ